MTEHEIATIDVQELKTRREDDPDLCLIDVREAHEWQTLRIPGASHIPKDELAYRIKAAVPDLDKPVYLHCRGGVRSLDAASCLMALGYKEVYSVDGGIAEWSLLGYPVES
ncbi:MULTISPECIES: rhodanese-like domain-containing protein [unclassified Legionella]|uniref:rhodanese-like domain-containing protein n=1 Tax=unclassified Legionella TaxID=2622702 RepID=UPI001056D5D0|nr:MULTISPECIES: rhodanese-like domain-containing protein [unclassified Legionella]MDI9819871.1 rhodanese-like domain-containing protein [Legionella sp. PL877]